MTFTEEQRRELNIPRSAVIWNPSLEFVCGSCHLAWGCLVTLVAVLLFGHLWALLFLPLIAFKELVIDVRIEYPQPPDGMAYHLESIDVAWYTIGSAVGHLLAVGLVWLGR